MKFAELFFEQMQKQEESLDPAIIDGVETRKYFAIPLKTDMLMPEQHSVLMAAWENGLYTIVENGQVFVSWDERLVKTMRYPSFAPYMDIIAKDKSKLPPDCPSCGTYMRKAIAKYGKYANKPVWVCGKMRGCLGQRGIV